MHERLSGITRILITAGKDAGLIPYTQEEIAAMREAKLKAIEEAMAGRKRLRHMLEAHSDIECTSEEYFLLGMLGEDPHPDHKITITECNHPDYQDKYGDGKTDLGLTPTNFRPEKLAV